jgi:hypothetical protein
MTQMIQQPRVQDCSVTGCGYNHDGCHAFAITIGRSDSECATFYDTPVKGGLLQITAQVGACKRVECTFNSDLECRAPSISVGPGKDLADCMTFQAR